MLTRYTLVLDLDETLVHYQEANNEGQINFRPYLDQFLHEMREYYDIIIFTASMKEYADIILDHIDPGRKLIKKRYYREDTIAVDNEYNIKDLGILKTDLKKTLIVDNVPENFLRHKENGIFIKSWYDDKNDTCLLELIPVLKDIVINEVEDVRVHLSNYREKLIEHIKKGCLNPVIHLKYC